MTGIRIVGFDRLDALDYRAEYPDARIRFESAAPRDSQHGELGAVAVIAVSIAGLQVLGAWLLKNRKGQTIERTVEIVGADGSLRKEVFRMNVSESTTTADIVSAITSSLKIDKDSLT